MKAFAAALASAVVWVMSPSVEAQDVRLDPDTGLPTSKPFEFPGRAAVAPFWAKRVFGYLTTSDGIRLRYSVLLPNGTGRFPVALSINAYDAGSIGGSAYLQHKTAMSVELDTKLVQAGYAVMGVNVAGSGCSEGALEYLRPQLGRHGAEAVEFAASQPWSDGNVGMVNWSYGGASQVATAQQQPAHLRAIVPGMVITDFRDALAPGGVPQPGFITPFRIGFRAYWERLVASTAREEGDERCLPQIDKNLAAEDTHSVMNLVTSHPLRDDYMNSFDLGVRADRIQVPVLSFEAFQDHAVTPRAGHYQSKLQPSKLWLVQTNGGHDMYRAAHFQALALRFLDRFVKGEANGFERDTPRTSVWMETSGAVDKSSSEPRWVVKKGSIKPEDLDVKELHLGAGNVLAEGVLAGAADRFDYPGTGVAVNDLAGNTLWGPLPADWQSTSLAYTSAPLREDMLVYGPASADLWVAANGGDADLQVTITELRPDGQETYVQRGWLRLSNRALDAARSTPLLPVHSERPDQLAPVFPGRPVFARIEVNKMGHYFRKGSRLRLWIDTPSQTGGLVFDTFTQKQQVYVLHNAKYDSLLRFATLKEVHGPQAYPECAALLMQPCRPDPFAQLQGRGAGRAP
jgi:predicted acyl esterase